MFAGDRPVGAASDRPARAAITWPRAARLLRSAEFRRVQGGGGRRCSTPHLVGVWARAEGSARFGLAVSRKVGNAVVRNHVKRCLRESLRHRRGGLTAVHVVFIARPGAGGASCATLDLEVATVLARVVESR